MRKVLIATICLFLWSFFARGESSPAAAEWPIRRGEVWAAVGDSITQGGTYYMWIALYHVTRFPTRQAEILNCGISGDTASGALSRYAWDIQPKKPSFATVMFGMNDVGRPLYGDRVDPKAIAERGKRLDQYSSSLKMLVQQLKRDGAQVMLITPTPYDEAVACQTPSLTGVDQALERCMEIMQRIAGEEGIPVIDLHSPLVHLNKELQQHAPGASWIGPDRVHPGEAAHLAAACHILEAWKAPTEISLLALDGAKGSVVTSRNVTVSDLNTREGRISFTSVEASLPFPIDEAAKDGPAPLPLASRFNRQELRISGLPGGRYELSIDGRRMAEFSNAELEDGVNLAAEFQTPMYQQALSVLKQIRAWQRRVAYADRGIAQIQHGILRAYGPSFDFSLTSPIVMDALEKAKSSDDPKEHRKVYSLERYLKIKPEEAEGRKQIRNELRKAFELAQPKAHQFEIRRMR